jgi:capsular exopolysaccharide synthesis family protein
MSPAELNQATRVTANDTSRILTIRVQDEDPQTAADLANNLSDQLQVLAAQVLGPESEVQVLAVADAPSSPVAPQVSVIAGLAALAGLLGALVLVVLIEYIDSTIRAREDVSRLVPVPFLGQIEGGRGERSSRSLVVERLPASKMASSYRVIAAKIAFADAEHPVRSLLVVGAQAGDGSGEMAANLATALATIGRRTVLVDGDTAEGEASLLLGLDDLPGLAEVARGQFDLSEVIVKHEPHLHVVPSGKTPLEVIDAETIRSVLSRLLATHDLVIIAGPSVLGSAEALVYARSTDASVVVVRRDQTKRQALTYAVESLTLVGANILGVVLDARSGERFGRRS